MKPVIIIALAFVLLIPTSVFAEEISSKNTILSPKEIPSWIKNTADWWSNNQITDEEFLSAIQYLTNSKIIEISSNNEYAPTRDLDELLKGLAEVN